MPHGRWRLSPRPRWNRASARSLGTAANPRLVQRRDRGSEDLSGNGRGERRRTCVVQRSVGLKTEPAPARYARVLSQSRWSELSFESGGRGNSAQATKATVRAFG